MDFANRNQGPFILVDQAGSKFRLELLTTLVTLIKITLDIIIII